MLQEALSGYLLIKNLNCSILPEYFCLLYTSVLARGDRKLSAVIYEAWKNGCKLDGWNEYFKPDIWNAAFEKFGIDKAFYANRKREYDEIAPWEHMDMLFDRSFLVRENIKAHEEKTTANCREKCADVYKRQFLYRLILRAFTLRKTATFAVKYSGLPVLMSLCFSH